MARRVPHRLLSTVAAVAALLAASSLAVAVAAAGGAVAGGDETEPFFTVLAHHGFDGRVPPATGPDTFRVYETARGRVERSNHFRWNGDFSVEIRDAAGDGDFPELQGYFAKRTGGQLFVHFALMVTDPAEPFNVALAGPAGFALRRDGIAFWLQARAGVLRHVSDSIPKPLLELSPFTWYAVDVLVDLDAGRYDLAVYEEGLAEAAVALAAQPTAAAQPGSAVDKFSFIGDTGEDVSRAVYYVDDIVIGADEELELPELVAPGRRRLFVEILAAGRDTDAGPAPSAREETAAGAAEGAGDAALLAGDPARAADLYRRALAAGGAPATLLLKLADAAYLRGDLAEEKALRERIYGSLDPRPEVAGAS